MNLLEIHCRGRVMFAQIVVHGRGPGMRDFYLYHKNSIVYYIFRKDRGSWLLAYGELADDIKEACIDALILRYDHDVPQMFYHQGKRYVVRVRPKKYNIWHFFVNDVYAASVQYDRFSKRFEYHYDEQTVLTEEHIQKYIDMIQQGKIRWRRR